MAMTSTLPVRMLCIAFAASLNSPAYALLTITELKARAATNSAIDCFELAWRYQRPLPLGSPEEDLSVPKDAAEAQKWFQKAYDLALPAGRKGDHKAQDMLGRICLEGFHDTNRIAEGVMWRRKAARGGNIHAQVALGHALLDRRWDLERNEEEAVKYLSAAAARKHRVAVSALVQFYTEKQDYKSAAKWLHMLAQFGEQPSQSQLGQWYAQGTGVQKDNVEAYKWLSLAAARSLSTNRPSTNGLSTSRMRLRAEWEAHMAREEQKRAMRRDVHGALLTQDEMKQAKRKIADFKKVKTFHEEATDD
jgi:TPR repeat protein